MKHLISVLIFIPLLSFAQGHQTGNGGDVVVCNDNTAEKTVELLDHFEARFEGWPIFYPQGTTAVEIAKKYFELGTGTHFSAHAPRWIESADGFLSQVRWVRSGEFQLDDISDSEHVVRPTNCEIEQIAIQRPTLPGRKKYVINRDLWEALPLHQRALLIVHELIYEEVLTGDSTNSVGVRYLTGLVASKQMDVHINTDQDFFKVATELLGLPLLRTRFGFEIFSESIENADFFSEGGFAQITFKKGQFNLLKGSMEIKYNDIYSDDKEFSHYAPVAKIRFSNNEVAEVVLIGGEEIGPHSDYNLLVNQGFGHPVVLLDSGDQNSGRGAFEYAILQISLGTGHFLIPEFESALLVRNGQWVRELYSWARSYNSCVDEICGIADDVVESVEDPNEMKKPEPYLLNNILGLLESDHLQVFEKNCGLGIFDRDYSIDVKDSSPTELAHFLGPNWLSLPETPTFHYSCKAGNLISPTLRHRGYFRYNDHALGLIEGPLRAFFHTNGNLNFLAFTPRNHPIKEALQLRESFESTEFYRTLKLMFRDGKSFAIQKGAEIMRSTLLFDDLLEYEEIQFDQNMNPTFARLSDDQFIYWNDLKIWFFDGYIQVNGKEENIAGAQLPSMMEGQSYLVSEGQQQFYNRKNSSDYVFTKLKKATFAQATTFLTRTGEPVAVEAGQTVEFTEDGYPKQ